MRIMNKLKINKINKIENKIPIKKYDISIKNNHNFFASGILVHNCTTMAKGYIHARSISDGALTPKQAWSREWVKNLWGKVKHDIPNDIRIIGENLFALHSIYYKNLDSYFFVFGITQNSSFLSWDDVVEWCGLLNLQHVPIIYEGIWDEEQIKSLWPINSDWSEEAEGYVMRVRDAFKIDDFSTSVSKFVRKNHIQTDETWFKGEFVANKLKKDN